ncbi:serine/threonine-protein kinase PknB [mine drainage metagenome]|uniref:Serine/threonine-protein kinase PknB n=1 Tax=mine drainage metagenome TaxID=410659 RepID=A0A1J5SGE8_9ZZZZ
MTVDRQREEDLFERARQLEGEAERKALLDRECAGDPALRASLEMLLAAERAGGRFFDEGRTAVDVLLTEADVGAAANPGGAQGLEADGKMIGSQIGRYKLIDKLGEGGWGTVYLAEQQEPVHRQVALKIVRLGMETRGIIARFEAERQALAMMDHPNIARVFDAGETDRGCPYFVMELVRGEKITDYCRRNRLGLPERLRLFVQVCHAIQHAHQKGIIHRDIKPSNIMVAMVDGNPVPKVIDFGIAKATEARIGDNAAATAYIQLIGTPAYMSPEQAEMRWMDVDTRSDIYSLGALLYELLTGRTPFDAKALMEAGVEGMRRMLRDREPPRPSARLLGLPRPELVEAAAERQTDPGPLISLLKGDLDWVVMKALEKERQRRYETADGLALDIQRHLAFEAVSARPPSWVYRLRKSVRRNRVVYAAGTAVALALIAGTWTSTWLLFKEREARRRAVAAEQQQSMLRRQAEVRERITQVNLLVNQDRYEQAARILSGLTLTRPSVEAAAAYRAVGEWYAIHDRWQEAVTCFRALLQLDALDGWDVSSLDALRLGPALINVGDREGYDRFRHDVVRSYLANPQPATDRVIKICLLAPLDESTRTALTQLAALSVRQVGDAESKQDVFQAAWISMSISVWEYRCGDFEQARRWAQRCLAYPDSVAPRSAAALAVLALSDLRLGHALAAREELAHGDAILAKKLQGGVDRGSPTQGFWFDWAFAQILLREAEGQIGQHGSGA